MYALKLSVQGMTLRRALSHCFFSSSLGACSVCEWPPSGSVLETLNTFFAEKKKFEMSTFKYSSQVKLQETCKQHTRKSLLDTLKARQGVACQRFILNAQQHPPLMDVTPSPKFHECEYSLRSRNPRLVLGRTNRLNDFVTVKYLLIVQLYLMFVKATLLKLIDTAERR